MAGGKKQSRRGYEPRHFRLYHNLMNSDAWIGLSGNAIKVYLAMARYLNGENNGVLPYSERKAASETGLDRRTCRNAFTELDQAGFIKPTSLGHFKMKQSPATTWRFTHLPAPGCDPAAPTRDFENWQSNGNKSRGHILSKHGTKNVPLMETSRKRGTKNAPPSTETSDFQSVSSGAKNVPQLVLPGGSRTNSETGNSWKHETGNNLDHLSELRNTLTNTLQTSNLGTQSRLAEEAGIPKGTLSKFVNGSGLALHHQTALKLELTKIGKTHKNYKLERK